VANQKVSFFQLRNRFGAKIEIAGLDESDWARLEPPLAIYSMAVHHVIFPNSLCRRGSGVRLPPLSVYRDRRKSVLPRPSASAAGQVPRVRHAGVEIRRCDHG